MSTNLNRAREKLVLSIHFTVYPRVDDNFISLIHTTPKRLLARRVCEVMHQCIPLWKKTDQTIESIEVNHD
jgi:hypothetical protein